MYDTISNISDSSSVNISLTNLECPVCLNIFSNAVYLCGNGHSMCENCKTNCRNCSQCSSPMTDTRNYALESIVNRSMMNCKNRSQGCTCNVSVRLRHSQLSDHEKVCGFRPVVCYKYGCANVNLPFGKYLDHIREAHGVTNHTGPLCWRFNLREIRSCIRISSTVTVRAMDSSESFLMNFFLKDDYVAICVLYFSANNEDADMTKYKCQFTIGHTENIEKRHKIPILLIQNFRILETNSNYFSVKFPKHHVFSLVDPEYIHYEDDHILDLYVEFTITSRQLNSE